MDPDSARNCVIVKEGNAVPDAVRYESCSHVSPLVAAATRHSVERNFVWNSARTARLNGLGRVSETAPRRLRLERGFAPQLVVNAKDQQKVQLREAEVGQVRCGWRWDTTRR